MSVKTCGLRRDTIDKFYTREEVVKDCMEQFCNRINISNQDICIEPSAGNGSFISSIQFKTLC